MCSYVVGDLKLSSFQILIITDCLLASCDDYRVIVTWVSGIMFLLF